MIELRDVHFGYRGSPLLFEAVSARFESGTMHALTGPSGSGKSTLLYLLGLLIRPTAGSVLIRDVAMSDRADADQSRRRGRDIGFVFQDAALDTGRSLLDNVLEGCAYTGLDRDSAQERALTLLADVDVVVPPERRPGQISGGQAQRVALCRALLHRPDILLADEPTGNLDPDSAALVLDRLARHADDGGCVVIATHDPRVLGRVRSIFDVSEARSETAAPDGG